MTLRKTAWNWSGSSRTEQDLLVIRIWKPHSLNESMCAVIEIIILNGLLMSKSKNYRKLVILIAISYSTFLLCMLWPKCKFFCFSTIRIPEAVLHIILVLFCFLLPDVVVPGLLTQMSLYTTFWRPEVNIGRPKHSNLAFHDGIRNLPFWSWTVYVPGWIGSLTNCDTVWLSGLYTVTTKRSSFSDMLHLLTLSCRQLRISTLLGSSDINWLKCSVLGNFN
jgi:hypothetical protein